MNRLLWHKNSDFYGIRTRLLCHRSRFYWGWRWSSIYWAALLSHSQGCGAGTLDTERDGAKLPTYTPPSPGSLKALLFPTRLIKVDDKGTQGVRGTWWNFLYSFLRTLSETPPTPTDLEESTAVHLQFVRQYAPHLCTAVLLRKYWGWGHRKTRNPKLLEKNSKMTPRTPTPNSLIPKKLCFSSTFEVFFEFSSRNLGSGSGGSILSFFRGVSGFVVLDPCGWPDGSQD